MTAFRRRYPWALLVACAIATVAYHEIGWTGMTLLSAFGVACWIAVIALQPAQARAHHDPIQQSPDLQHGPNVAVAVGAVIRKPWEALP